MSNGVPIGAGLRIGEYTTSDISADLGREWPAGENTVRLVKASAAISSPDNKIVLDSFSSGVRLNAVNVTTSAGSNYAAGVIPDMNGSTIPASAYFLLYVDGPVDVLVANTTAADGGYLQTSTTSGAVASIAPASPSDLDKAPLRQHGDPATAAGGTVKAVLRKVI